MTHKDVYLLINLLENGKMKVLLLIIALLMMIFVNVIFGFLMLVLVAWKASCGVEKQPIYLFSTPQEAFHAYKVAKENHIKLLAEKYRDQIDPRAYEALSTL